MSLFRLPISPQTIKSPLSPFLLSPNTANFFLLSRSTSLTMANWELGEPFQGLGPNALSLYLGPRTISWAHHVGAPWVDMTYLYMRQDDARLCVDRGDFAEISTHYMLTRRLPSYGAPLSGCDWWLAVPLLWCEGRNFQYPASLRNAEGFPVVAWGRVTASYEP